jgi:hypothetical protein
MDTSICKLYWDNFFLHYILFGFIGSLIATLIILIPRNFLKSKFWLKSSLIFILVNLSSCSIERVLNLKCQLKLFGYVSDDPGDIGIVFITLPIFLVCMIGGLTILFWKKKRLALQVGNSK